MPYKNLKCPKCGFSFGIGYPDDLTKEEEMELMTCPCGTIMDDMGSSLDPNVVEPPKGAEE